MSIVSSPALIRTDKYSIFYFIFWNFYNIQIRLENVLCANYWISRPPILVRGLPLIPIPSRPLRVYSVIELQEE